MERYPNLKEEVGGSIPGSEISSLLDRNLALVCRPSVSKRKRKKASREITHHSRGIYGIYLNFTRKNRHGNRPVGLGNTRISTEPVMLKNLPSAIDTAHS